MRSEAAFAHLCGTSPIDASSGLVVRKRLNRGGDRQANHALWRIVMVRVVSDPDTRHYVDRRRSTLQTRAAAQTIEIVRVPVAGGTARVLAEGVDPQLSPDGQTMAFRPYSQRAKVAIMNLATMNLATMNLATMTARLIDAPTSNGSSDVLDLAWLSDPHRLLVTVGAPTGVGSCPPGGTCPTTPPAPPRTGFEFDTADDHWTARPEPDGVSRGWDALTLQGPGPTPGTVLAVSTPDGSTPVVYTIDIANGTIASRFDLPPQTFFLARDKTATNYLVAGSSGVLRISTSQPVPVPVGGPASEGAW